MHSFKNKCILCLRVLCLSVCLHITCMQYPQRSEQDLGSPGTGVKDGLGLPDGCWEFNLAPPEEQPMLSTKIPYEFYAREEKKKKKPGSQSLKRNAEN